MLSKLSMQYLYNLGARKTKATESYRKAVCNWVLFTVERVPFPAELELGTARSLGQHLTYWSIRAPVMSEDYGMGHT